MSLSPSAFAGGLTARPYSPADVGAVLDVVNADRLPGQPRVTAGMLGEALAGRSPVDSGWWADLADLRTDVLTGPTGAAVGVVAYAVRPRDDAGVILWLHGREDPTVVAAAVDHAAASLSDRSVLHAFDFATALGLGLEALPVRHRPATHAALCERSFTSSDLWRYMHRRLPATELPRASGYRTVSEDGKQHLRLHNGDRLVGEATIGVPMVGGIGVLWWLHVDPAARGCGLGAALLGSALDRLARLGAREVILYVDDDDPGGERDRSAANRLYERCGFTEVDRLHSYRRSR
jgi:ribosomal protein S18 acetylase RimI-like enzyme